MLSICPSHPAGNLDYMNHGKTVTSLSQHILLTLAYYPILQQNIYQLRLEMRGFP